MIFVFYSKLLLFNSFVSVKFQETIIKIVYFKCPPPPTHLLAHQNSFPGFLLDASASETDASPRGAQLIT